MGFVPHLPDPDALLRARRAAERWLEPFLMGEPAPEEAYAATVTTWLASTSGTTTEAVPSTLREARERFPDLRREDIRVDLLADAVLVQSTLVGSIGGRPVRLPTCVIARLDDDGMIHRIEHYGDVAELETTSDATAADLPERG